MQRKWRNIFCAACIVLLLISSGCASVPVKGYGSLVADGRVMDAFDKFKVNPNYNYFYSGSEVYPNAVIGLDKTYTLESDLWKKVDMTPSKMKEIVTFMKDKAATVNLTTALHGFVIFDDKGKQIGVWYSIFQAMTNAAVRMTGDKTVQIDTPDVDTWLKLEDGGRHIR